MQRQRREELAASGNSQRTTQVPQSHWQSLQDINPDMLQRNSGGFWADEKHLILNVLNREVRVSAERQQVEIENDGTWLKAPPFLAFVTVVYLINARETALSGRWVSEKDLSSAHFFSGIHGLQVEGLLDRFGNAPDDLLQSAAILGGVPTNDPGDAAVRLWVFPSVPLKLILWCRDDELPASITVLFDYSIDKLLPADGIWAMVRLISDTLVEAGGA